MSKRKLKYRSKGGIIADMLSAVQDEGDARVTQILYKANLSHDRLTRYLGELLDSGLIVEVNDQERSHYRITEKGRKFLMEFRRMEEFAKAFGLDI